MGDLNRTLATVRFQDNPARELSIELNHGGPNNAGIVHLQTDSWRIELTGPEFRGFAKTTVKAAKALRQQKGLPPGAKP